MASNRMIRGTTLLILMLAAPLSAQVMSRPTDPPLVTAANESWYQLGEPIQFAGDLYYRAGAAVFFDGNVMVRSGYYNGVPLYVDTTVEPFSIVLVPVRSGLMQPYERLRRGDLAGTTGSRTPSFPSRVTPDRSDFRESLGAPTELPRPIGAIPVFELNTPARPQTVNGPTSVPVAVPVAQAAPSGSAPMVSITRPEGNDGVWIHFQGVRWVSAGAAVPLRPSEFRAIGNYEGFPVFVRKDQEKTIYLPTRGGLVAPYKAR
jgi:hypothetical protein